MIVTCHRCRTSFRLSPAMMRPGGTTVRCSRCGTIFRALPPSARTALRPGPPPGVSDEDYVLHGGPAPEPRPKEAAPGAAEAAAALAAFESTPAEAQPIEAEPVAAQPRPEPETRPAPAPEPPTPEPAEVAPEPEPSPKAAEPEPAPPEPEPSPPEPEPVPGPDLAETAAGAEPATAQEPAPEAAAEPAEAPWPEPEHLAEAPSQPLPPPRPARAPSRLSAWRQALIAGRPPLALGALAAALLLVVGLLVYRAGIIGGERVDPKGTRKITFTGISGYFVKNDHDGVVYVVQGLARNGYQERRKRIQIKAALYDGAGEPVREEFVYAGNIFSREELQRTPLKELATALASPVETGSHSVVRPGATVPFMAVFGNLPESLGEFSLEAASSSRASSS